MNCFEKTRNSSTESLGKFNYRPFVVWFLGSLYIISLISLVAFSIYQLPVPLGTEIDKSSFSEQRYVFILKVHLQPHLHLQIYY